MSLRFLKDAQKRWARQQGFDLIGSKGDRGEPAYTPTLRENLFESIRSATRCEFEKGDGDELVTTGGPAKMQAVHSSAAVTVNLFDYWRDRTDRRPLERALRLAADNIVSIEFEAKRPIMNVPNRRIFRKDPNLDVVIGLPDSSDIREVGFECKFMEPFRPLDPKKKGLARAYLREEQLWHVIPKCHELARGISPSDNSFVHLHAAQLLKHILGLKHRNGRTGFVLVYLWFDCSSSAEADRHLKELGEFSEIVSRDGISFLPTTFQQVIAELSKHREGHERYVDYLADRYL